MGLCMYDRVSPGSGCGDQAVGYNEGGTFPLLSTHLCCLQLPLSPEALPLSSPLAPLPGQQGSEARVIRVSINNDHGNLYRSILVRG